MPKSIGLHAVTLDSWKGFIDYYGRDVELRSDWLVFEYGKRFFQRIEEGKWRKKKTKKDADAEEGDERFVRKVIKKSAQGPESAW